MSTLEEKAKKAAQFDRRVEMGAAAAYGAMLSSLASEYDLGHLETATSERLAKLAWNFGILFAEAVER